DRTQLKNLQKSAYDNVAKLSAAQADYEKAYKVKVIADSIQTKIIKGQNIEHAQELDIKYEVKEKQNIITEQKAAIKTHKSLNILLFILGAISLIGGYFIYTYLNKQAQNAKQKAQQLAMQLNEVWLKYEQLYENQSIETRGVLVENEQSTPIYLDSNEQQQEKIIQQHSENNTYIEFKEDREIKKIAYTAIYYIKSGKNYQEFFDKSDKRIGMILLPLSNLHQLLPENFCRVQKSYIVNKNYLAEKKIIKRGKKEFVMLSNDVEIPFSDKFDEIDGFPLL
nr:LytTR family transcriptional regulator [Bacteroidia bacterium]